MFLQIELYKWKTWEPQNTSLVSDNSIGSWLYTLPHHLATLQNPWESLAWEEKFSTAFGFQQFSSVLTFSAISEEKSRR